MLFGFNSLQIVAPEPCQPFGARRVGLSLDEAGGLSRLLAIPGATHKMTALPATRAQPAVGPTWTTPCAGVASVPAIRIQRTTARHGSPAATRCVLRLVGTCAAASREVSDRLRGCLRANTGAGMLPCSWPPRGAVGENAATPALAGPAKTSPCAIPCLSPPITSAACSRRRCRTCIAPRCRCTAT
ncbi:hypothetical protein XarbCFBP7408_18170 [Xanthomonas arboricola pv. guizotiae]|uniref:Uncharacterized protein n=1 Tax=Xanthomonas arboricola pv. guizotiae TaxID=487867 RepID=A0A2S6ZV36_9XANT|nr:hypothetical protein XarbCFBP7409_15910 [Xanthomonas arboricola pv. guizotiae]PPU20096.1 hypothetical protein XarbCFBP7408_18170 [Xanthomonas arboricola pv. guizotiae]